MIWPSDGAPLAVLFRCRRYGSNIAQSLNFDPKRKPRASKSEAIPFGETPEQRKREFQEALRKILRVGQDRDSSNKKIWTEALHLLDNPRVRVLNRKR